MVTADQAGETDADARSPTHTGDKKEILPKAHGRSTEQNQPPENLRKESYGEGQRRRVRSTVRHHFVPSNARSLLSPSPSLL